MNLLKYQYLDDDHLIGLNEYKYNSIDTSPVSVYIMQPFWSWCVKFFPTWFAPNLMTFLGFLFLIGNFVLFSYYDFHFTEALELPRWIWLVATVFQFSSHQLDGMDGKQARRTKTSSALGELFDHGVDSWASFLFPACFFSVVSMNEYGFSPISMHLLLLSTYTTFICTHWEKYNTKVLFLPWAYDISMLLLTIAYLLTFFFTPNVFRFDIPIIDVPFLRFVEYAWPLCGLISSIPISVVHIYQSYQTGKGYNRTFYEAVRPLISPAILFMSSTWWGIASPHRILHKQPRIFLTAVGTTFSNIACRLIVAEMTATRSNGINILLYIFVPVQIMSVYGVIMEQTEFIFLSLYNAIAIFAHVHYGYCVVGQICTHLNIYAFKITNYSKNPPTDKHYVDQR